MAEQTPKAVSRQSANVYTVLTQWYAERKCLYVHILHNQALRSKYYMVLPVVQIIFTKRLAQTGPGAVAHHQTRCPILHNQALRSKYYMVLPVVQIIFTKRLAQTGPGAVAHHQTRCPLRWLLLNMGDSRRYLQGRDFQWSQKLTRRVWVATPKTGQKTFASTILVPCRYNEFFLYRV